MKISLRFVSYMSDTEHEEQEMEIEDIDRGTAGDVIDRFFNAVTVDPEERERLLNRIDTSLKIDADMAERIERSMKDVGPMEIFEEGSVDFLTPEQAQKIRDMKKGYKQNWTGETDYKEEGKKESIESAAIEAYREILKQTDDGTVKELQKNLKDEQGKQKSRPKSLPLVGSSANSFPFEAVARLKEDPKPQPEEDIRTLDDGTVLYSCRYVCPTCEHTGKRYIRETNKFTKCHDCKTEIHVEPAVLDNKSSVPVIDENGYYFLALEPFKNAKGEE